MALTPPPVWLLVPASLTTSLRSFVMTSTGCLCPQRIQFKVELTAIDCVRGSGPAYFKDVCIPLADIVDCIAGRSRSNPSSAQHVETWLCHGPELSSVVGAFRLQHQSSGMRFLLPPLNIHQSRTIQSLVEKPVFSTKPTTSSENIVILRVHCTYLLTYLLTY